MLELIGVIASYRNMKEACRGMRAQRMTSQSMSFQINTQRHSTQAAIRWCSVTVSTSGSDSGVKARSS